MNEETMEVSAILSFFMHMEDVRRDRSRYPLAGVEYTFHNGEDGTVTLSRFRGDRADVAIPAEYEGRPVTAIAPYAFAGCEKLRTVRVPQGVRKIGTGAFACCPALHEVSLPDTLCQMEDQVFAECEALEILLLPDALESVPAGLCRGCTALHEVRLPRHAEMHIGWQAFSECENLRAVDVPEGAVALGEMAFFNCGKLESVTLPETLLSIDSNAFAFCRKLQEVEIPRSVRRFGQQVFFGCSALMRAVLPAALTDVAGNPFGCCANLMEIEVDKGNPVLEMNGPMLLHLPRRAVLSYLCGQDAGFVIVPAGTKEIADHAFSGCSALCRVTLPEGIAKLGNAAFSDCRSLRAVNLPGSLTDIGVDLFDGCSGVEMDAPAQSYAARYANKRQRAMSDVTR